MLADIRLSAPPLSTGRKAWASPGQLCPGVAQPGLVPIAPRQGADHWRCNCVSKWQSWSLLGLLALKQGLDVAHLSCHLKPGRRQNAAEDESHWQDGSGLLALRTG